VDMYHPGESDGVICWKDS